MVFDPTSGHIWALHMFGPNISEITTTGLRLRTCRTPRARSNGFGAVTLVGSDLYIAENNPDGLGEIFVVDKNSLSCQTFNVPPTAEAGANLSVECLAPFTAVTLDGTGSHDPNGDPLSYTWTFPDGFTTVTGATPTVRLPVGSHTLTLTVDDGHGEMASDTVSVVIQDTRSPLLTFTGLFFETTATQGSGTAELDVIATFGVNAVDTCDPNPVITHDAPDEFPIGVTPVTITATDASGNVVSQVFTVTVVRGQPADPGQPPGGNGGGGGGAPPGGGGGGGGGAPPGGGGRPPR